MASLVKHGLKAIGAVSAITAAGYCYNTTESVANMQPTPKKTYKPKMSGNIVTDQFLYDEKYILKNKKEIDEKITLSTQEICDGKYSMCVFLAHYNSGLLDMDIIKEHENLPDYIENIFRGNYQTVYSLKDDPNHWLAHRLTCVDLISCYI
jgi:hypothetical protein